MKLFDKNNIVNYWDEIIPKEVYMKLYKQIRKEILNDLFKDHFVKMIDKNLDDISKDEMRILNEE